MFSRRPWLIPLVIVALVAGLIVPLAYFILQAAYERDVQQNAATLALRVQRDLAQAALAQEAQADRENRVLETLNRELAADPTVQAVVFYDLTSTPARGLFAMRRDPTAQVPTLTPEEIHSYARPQMTRTEDAQSVKIVMPFLYQNRLVAFTYMDFSKQALQSDFWSKEGPLLWRVFWLASAAVACLSAASILAYRSRRQLSTTQTRAQLAQQGMLAERGLTAAVLAHEIRNPLAALRFQLHSLRKTTDPQRVTQAAETIDAELLRIQQLVTDYLEHEKAATLRTQAVDLYRACLDLQTLMSELLRSTGTRLALIPPDHPVTAQCDPHALRQVLMNLVLNAQQAMGRLGTITLRVSRRDAMAELAVSDTGPGLPEQIKENLFKPFQTTKAEGTGIGLALVKRFADNFGGSVEVESSPQGTTFRLMLPVVETPLS
jgi:signal transduction histidine kinase